MSLLSPNKKFHLSFKTICIVLAVVFLFYIIIFVCMILHGNVPNSEYFGVSDKKISINSKVGVIDYNQDTKVIQQQRLELTSYTTRDISGTISKVLEQREQRIQAEMQARYIDNLNHINNAKNNRARQMIQYSLPPLSEINWDAGHDNFISEWTSKLDVYLSGSPLSGCGSIFAQAAWDYGIDPRWSAAISNTESSKGAVCFLPHNAWGWGQSSWDNWHDAIYEHVKRLSEDYGYTICRPFAVKYCPPNSEHWYYSTLEQMRSMG